MPHQSVAHVRSSIVLDRLKESEAAAQGVGALELFVFTRHSGARVNRAGSESITTIGSMDSGLAPSGASTMCNCTSGNDNTRSTWLRRVRNRGRFVIRV